MMLWRSGKKSVELRRISRLLGTMPPTSLDDTFREWSSSHDRAMERLFRLCESDPAVAEVMGRYGATRETLARAYEALLTEGAMTWERGHLVCVSALCFAQTLDYVLANLELLSSPSSSARVVLRLIHYFRNGEVGEVV